MSKHDIFQIMNDYHSDNEILKSEAKKAVIEDYSKFVSYIINANCNNKLDTPW